MALTIDEVVAGMAAIVPPDGVVTVIGDVRSWTSSPSWFESRIGRGRAVDVDQVWARDTALTVLRRRGLAGEGPATLLELQPLVGIGPVDLSSAVELLVEEGKVLRHAEGPVASYEAAPDGYGAVEPPAPVAAPEPAAGEPPSPFAGAAEQAMPPARVRPGEVRELRMSSAMAQAMHPDAIGGLVMAGIIEAQDAGADFVFTVTP